MPAMRALVLLALSLAVASPPARADDRPDRITRLEKTGFALARRGKYKEAVEAFQELLRLAPYPSGLLLYNLGKLSEEGLHDRAKASVYYQGYLAIEPDGADVTDVRRRLDHLNTQLATSMGSVSLISRADGIPVRIDDVPMGSTPVTGMVLPAGEHTATAETDDYFPASIRFLVEAGTEARVELPLKKRIFKGTLTVVVDPPDATIRINGQVVSEKAPYTQKDMPTRTVLVQIDKPGWDRWVRYVTVERDSEVKVEARLEQTDEEVPVPPLPANDD